MHKPELLAEKTPPGEVCEVSATSGMFDVGQYVGATNKEQQRYAFVRLNGGFCFNIPVKPQHIPCTPVVGIGTENTDFSPEARNRIRKIDFFAPT